VLLNGRIGLASVVLLWAFTGCGPESPAERESAIKFHTPYGRPQYPFSPAVQVGNLLFLAGQIGTDSTGKLVPGGIKAEARQAMENIGDVLQRVGSSWDQVVKCTIMMADMAEWPAMNAVYATYFPRQFPARSAFGATAVALGARVEIECVAMG
jgi:2-iminobutanoate/2-iminopropanoate deaminase